MQGLKQELGVAAEEAKKKIKKDVATIKQLTKTGLNRKNQLREEKLMLKIRLKSFERNKRMFGTTKL